MKGCCLLYRTYGQGSTHPRSNTRTSTQLLLLLQAWLAGPARLTNKAEDEDRVLTLQDICLALDFLHARDLVHGALCTEAVMWFEQPRRSACRL